MRSKKSIDKSILIVIVNWYRSVTGGTVYQVCDEAITWISHMLIMQARYKNGDSFNLFCSKRKNKGDTNHFQLLKVTMICIEISIHD